MGQWLTTQCLLNRELVGASEYSNSLGWPQLLAVWLDMWELALWAYCRCSVQRWSKEIDRFPAPTRGKQLFSFRPGSFIQSWCLKAVRIIGDRPSKTCQSWNLPTWIVEKPGLISQDKLDLCTSLCWLGVGWTKDLDFLTGSKWFDDDFPKPSGLVGDDSWSSLRGTTLGLRVAFESPFVHWCHAFWCYIATSGSIKDGSWHWRSGLWHDGLDWLGCNQGDRSRSPFTGEALKNKHKNPSLWALWSFGDWVQGRHQKVITRRCSVKKSVQYTWLLFSMYWPSRSLSSTQQIWGLQYLSFVSMLFPASLGAIWPSAVCTREMSTLQNDAIVKGRCWLSSAANRWIFYCRLHMILTCFYAHNLEHQSRDACCVATLPPLIRDPFDDARARTSWRCAPELANTCAFEKGNSFVFQECDVHVKQREAPKSAIKSRSEPSTALSHGKLQVVFFVCFVIGIVYYQLSFVSGH